MNHLGLRLPSMNTLPSNIRKNLDFHQQATREVAIGELKEMQLSVLQPSHFQQL